jgi:hypothetical protein
VKQLFTPYKFESVEKDVSQYCEIPYEVELLQNEKSPFEITMGLNLIEKYMDVSVSTNGQLLVTVMNKPGAEAVSSSYH